MNRSTCRLERAGLAAKENENDEALSTKLERSDGNAEKSKANAPSVRNLKNESLDSKDPRVRYHSRMLGEGGQATGESHTPPQDAGRPSERPAAARGFGRLEVRERWQTIFREGGKKVDAKMTGGLREGHKE